MLLSVMIVMLLITSSLSCAKPTILNPLEDELKFFKKGEIVPADGVWMTENYLQVVGDVKINKSHL